MTAKPKTEKSAEDKMIEELDKGLIQIPPLSLQEIEIEVIGTTPLIVHAWSQKAKEMILAKQKKKPVKEREVRNPEQEYKEAFYPKRNGKHTFPGCAFKQAAVTAVTSVPGFTKVAARQAFHLMPEYEWVEIDGEPRMREDMVRIGMGTADLRFRPEFPNWKARIGFQYNTNVISAEQILSLMELAGFSVGIGEHRPEKDGNFGRFRCICRALPGIVWQKKAA